METGQGGRAQGLEHRGPHPAGWEPALHTQLHSTFIACGFVTADTVTLQE